MTTVYVVDDDAPFADLLASVVSRRGLRPQKFGTGEQFLESVQSDATGCVVLDLVLPGLSGLDVLAALQSRDLDLPVIVVSGHASVPIAVQAMRAGATTVLEKPFPLSELHQGITTALEVEQFRKTERMRRREIAGRYASLSEAERNVIDLLLTGSPNKAVAAQLSMSLRTVERYRSSALKKLAADSLVEAGTNLAILRDSQSGSPDHPSVLAGSFALTTTRPSEQNVPASARALQARGA